MSDLYMARTNQKLSFARLHLEALQSALSSNGWSKHALIESYNESILFHLQGAVHAFIREVAEHYRLECEHIDTVSELRELFDQSGQESPELNELEQLVSHPGSWLDRLGHAYAACWQACNRRVEQSSERSVSEIHVVQINPDHAEDGAMQQEYEQWFGELRTLVDRLRSSMQEW